jgi:hypothetical protein
MGLWIRPSQLNVSQHESCMRTIKNYQIRKIDGIDLRNVKREHMESMGITFKKNVTKHMG